MASLCDAGHVRVKKEFVGRMAHKEYQATDAARTVGAKGILEHGCR